MRKQVPQHPAPSSFDQGALAAAPQHPDLQGEWTCPSWKSLRRLPFAPVEQCIIGKAMFRDQEPLTTSLKGDEGMQVFPPLLFQ